MSGIDPSSGAAPSAGPPRPQEVPACPLTALAELLDAPLLDAQLPDAELAPVSVTGVTHASAQVRPGDLYAALPGTHRHGAEFAGVAADAGAVALLTDPAGAATVTVPGLALPLLVVPDPRARLGEVATRVYGEPGSRLAVLGITGTAGKTTTAYLIEAGLRDAGRTTGLLGSVEARLGGRDGDLVVDSVRTTPEATDLHALLAVAVQRGVEVVVMEVSSHALALDRVGGLRFAAGGYTNFGLDHLDFHRDADDYFAAKARLFDGRCDVEILNHDDPSLARLRRSGTVTFSADGDPAATWRAEQIVTAADGFSQRFHAVGPGESVPAGVGQPGRHSVANALLAIAALVAAGVGPEDAAASVAMAPGVPGRLQRVGDGTAEPLGVVDYAHKPDAVRAVLDALRQVTRVRGGRLVCVLGAGGDRDTGKRAPMGAAAAQLANLVVITDDNPRTEDPAAIRAAVRAGAAAGGAAEVIEVAGRRDAIGEAVRRCRATDVVAVLGKGHERGQEIGGQVHPFDDRAELAGALRAAAGAAGAAR